MNWTGYTYSDVTPVTEPITVDDVKLQLKGIPDASEDTLIATYITAARRQVEKYSQRLLVDKIVRVSYDAWHERLYLPFPTEEEDVTSIVYTDSDSVPGTVDALDRYLANVPQPNYVEAARDSWDLTGDRIIVTYTANAVDYYIDALKPAVLLLAAHYYQHRIVSDFPMISNVMNIIKAHRLYTTP